MKLNPPTWLRVALYVLTLVGTPIVGYLNAKGYIGELEVNLWFGLVTVAGTVAALNVSTTPDTPREPGKHERALI